MSCIMLLFFFFFFNDTATTEIYTLSLHDALPILSDNGYYYGEHRIPNSKNYPYAEAYRLPLLIRGPRKDRKSTRLNSSHANISYAVFCLKKKKYNNTILLTPFSDNNTTTPYTSNN